MKIEEIERKLSKIEGLLSGTECERIVSVAMSDLCAYIANRVIETGKGCDNRPFRPYSNVKYPAFWYFGRSRNTAGESRVRSAAKRSQGVSYRDFRIYNGLPVGFKNFSFTNEMWRGFGVKSMNRRGNVIASTIGGKTPTSEEKIENMGRIEGRSIIQPTRAELDSAARAIVLSIKRAAGL